jgi:hypothetical protein
MAKTKFEDFIFVFKKIPKKWKKIAKNLETIKLN